MIPPDRRGAPSMPPAREAGIGVPGLLSGQGPPVQYNLPAPAIDVEYGWDCGSSCHQSYLWRTRLESI
jgi:hypothetical protein